MDPERARKTEQLHNAFAAGILDEETYRELLAALGGTTSYTATADSDSTLAQDHSTSVAPRAANIGRDAQIVITGDNNSVQAILRQDGLAQLDEASLLREIGNYLTWLRDRSSTIELRGIKREGQQVVQLDLETVYVPLQARVFGNGRFDDDRAESLEREVALNEVLALGPRLVITGGPGCGKTTVLQHLAYALCRLWATEDAEYGEDKLGLQPPAPLPIFLPLSAYAAFLRDLPRGAPAREKTLAAFISRYMIEKQSGFDLPADFFAQLLRSGQAILLLLDGLDEVPDEAQRTAVREAIEELVTGREELRVVVTCRSAAYKDRTALGKGFREVKVQPLKEEQITPLVQQAYAAIYPNSVEKQTEQAGSLLEGIQRLEAERRSRLGRDAERLVTSPLMVRLLLVVHFSERRLPEQRAELFMKATDAMLLPDYALDQAVADEIGQLVGGSREKHRALVQYLAYHMHQQGPDQGREISEFDLRRILAQHDAYRDLAGDFVALTRLRGTIMEERLGMYRFLHLGFQEFLAARYLATVTALEEGLAGVVRLLLERAVDDSWWREPILLLAGYLSETTPPMATRFLRQLGGLEGVPGAAPLAEDLRWAAAELAAGAATEWQGLSEEDQAALARRLAGLFADEEALEDVRPSLRAAAGAALGYLGDPRAELVDVDAMQFCLIPAGDFWMGEGEDLHLQDCLDYDYWLGRYPVTYAQYEQFLHSDDYEDDVFWRETLRHNPGYAHTGPRLLGGLPGNVPIYYATWYDAQAFARWLDARWLGRLPAGLHVQLATEAQWEKAARGGLQIPTAPLIWQPFLEDMPVVLPGRQKNPDPQRLFPWGKRQDSTYANCREAGIGRSSSAGCFPAGVSPYGCLDMSGNVWEWTSSLFDPYPYAADEHHENLGAGSLTSRVLRGGSYAQSLFTSSKERISMRCASRYRSDPNLWRDIGGFRVVVSPLLTADL